MTRIYAFAWVLFLLGRLAHATDDLSPLSDEFTNATTLSNWQRIHAVEGWNADQLQHLDINTSMPGWLTMMPYASTWYQNYRGELTFKAVTGDFVASTYVRATNRAQSGAPGEDFSLAGILVRTPRAITNPATDWTAGGENYVFLSFGSAGNPGNYQWEVKTTINSVSTLTYETTGTLDAQIQVARLGSTFIMLRRVLPGGQWHVHRRYQRTDMPATMQVGMTVYTDYSHVSSLTPFVHNSSVITTGTPDLIARFDYFRFARPVIPPAYASADFSSESEVPDSVLLSFLGEAALPVRLSRFETE
ncbi:MAG: hypothetical protein K1X53_17035 [Candidatus Sumerlaeaceae bacterium]|nr:hypothetical protein [Candidatus Sumerlaeaceae bacterium]